MGDGLIAELDDTEGEKLTDHDCMLVILSEADELPKSLAEASGEALPIALIDENGV